MMRLARLLSLALVALAAAAAFAETISGTVTNASTGKPAAGAAVTLVDPMGGMAELASAKADAQGRFHFDAPAAQGPRLVRAERAGVTYFKMITPGASAVEINVYDAAASVEGISGAADVLRLQTQDGNLQATELFALRNASKPPRTLAAPATFEFVLPEGAQLDNADAQSPNGQPISVKPEAGKQKNHYNFSFPLKPGETRFQIAYHMPYSGQAAISPQLTRSFDHYVLVLPSTISFTPRDSKAFQPMNDQPGVNVQVSMKAAAGSELGYQLSGEGTIREQSEAASEGGGGMSGAAEESRPGGGLGKPIEAPDALAKYRWYILAALMTVLVGGGIWTRERTLQQQAAPATPEGAPYPPSSGTGGNPEGAPYLPSSGRGIPTDAIPTPSDAILTALKEELFALEVEHQQGKITAEEYEKSRAALEQTLHRALSRRKG
jgi:hypothetical protein